MPIVSLLGGNQSDGTPVYLATAMNEDLGAGEALFGASSSGESEADHACTIMAAGETEIAAEAQSGQRYACGH